jgi:hypothetical protein
MVQPVLISGDDPAFFYGEPKIIRSSDLFLGARPSPFTDVVCLCGATSHRGRL